MTTRVAFDPRQVRLAISPIGWTNDDWPDLGGDIPFATCIREMAAAGYAGCEAGGKFPRQPAALLAALQPLDLEVASAWTDLYFTDGRSAEETLDSFGAHCEFLRAMGAAVVVACECGGAVHKLDRPVAADRPRFDEEQWRQLVDGLHRAGELATDLGLTLAYHPHMGTGVQTATEIERLMAATDPAFVSLLVDSGHAAFAGDDPAEIVRRHGPRVRHVHLKDVRREVLESARQGASFEQAVRAGVFTVPGDGSLDQVGLLAALAETGYTGWLVIEAEQDPAQAPPLEYARRARTFLREVTGL